METPDLGPYLSLCGSKLPILPPGSGGLRSVSPPAAHSGRPRGTWTHPCRAPGEQSGALKTPALQHPGPRLWGPRGRLVPSEMVLDPRARPRQDAVCCRLGARPPQPLSDAVHGFSPSDPEQSEP